MGIFLLDISLPSPTSPYSNSLLFHLLHRIQNLHKVDHSYMNLMEQYINKFSTNFSLLEKIPGIIFVIV